MAEWKYGSGKVAELKLLEEFLLEPPPKKCEQNCEFVNQDPSKNDEVKNEVVKTEDGNENGVKQSESGEVKSESQKKKRGRNKNRPAPQRFDRSIRLCPVLIDVSPTRQGDPRADCTYENCKFIHDVAKFMSEKPADLGDRCYVYENFGRCRNGLVCRFGSCHIVKTVTEDKDGNQVVVYRNKVNTELYEKIVSKSSSGDCSGRKLGQESNQLKKDLQKLLWKKNYDFKKCDAIIDREFKERNKRAEEEKRNGAEPEQNGKCVEETDGPECKKARLESREVTETIKNAEAVVEMSDKLPVAVSLEEDKEIHYKEPRKKIDWTDKLYLAPLTTVGNMPFRRICKKFGADITCGEMAMALPLLQGSTPEWALVQKHVSEDVFGIQICGSSPHQMGRVAQLVQDGHIDCDFVDINMGCPIDLVFNRGMGSGLMNRKKPLEVMVRAMSEVMTRVPLTLKMRTGVYADKRIAHTIIPQAMTDWGAEMVTLHGRSREQRYSKLADWKYIGECAEMLPQGMPVYGNGDIVNWEDYNQYRQTAPRVSGVMIARGALIKPWVFKEIKEQKHWDISPQERLDIVRDFANYGLEHWGSDDKGVENTRRFMLEWLSFLHRYVPVGMLAEPPQRMNERVPKYFKCRGDLETMLSSPHCDDWIKISEMFLGKVPDGFNFQPKHKAHGYKEQTVTTGLTETTTT